MGSSMTNTEHLRELIEQATPADWIASEADYFGDHNIQSKDGVETDTNHLVIAAVISNLRPAAEVAANAALIVALVNQAPAMLDELDALREALRIIAGPPEDSFMPPPDDKPDAKITWPRWSKEQCRDIARAALEQENSHG